MRFGSNLSTADVLEVFAEEIADRGGRVADVFDDGRRLFARSVLPGWREVTPGDKVQGGVAVKATDEAVCLYPYVFRLACTNGAIVAETIGATTVDDLELQDTYSGRQAIRDAVEVCVDPKVFASNVGKMRSSAAADVDFALNLMPLATRFAGHANRDMLAQVLDRFFRDEDRSRFGLANAVTSFARDTRDPALRWELEEFGGALAVGVTPPLPVGLRRMVRARSRQEVAVG
jgi:hypothetical protein